MATQQAPSDYYEYVPSLAGNIVIVVLFTGLLFGHLFRLYSNRTWFCIPFTVGAIFEMIGFSARAQSSKTPAAFTPFLIQALFVLLAPILFAASVYMFLSRIIRSTEYTSLSMIRPKLLTIVFVTGDIICFLVQMVGAALMGASETPSEMKLAESIILAGLAVQIFIFGVFVLVAVVFHRRVRGMGGSLVVEGVNWEHFLYLLYTVSLIITFRNIFRVIEHGFGDDGYLLTREWPIFVFDAIPMAGVLVVCMWWYVHVASLTTKELHQMMPGAQGGGVGTAV